MEKIKSILTKSRELKKFFGKWWILGAFLVITIAFTVFTGLKVYKNPEDNFNDFLIILFISIPCTFIQLKFGFHILYYFDFCVNIYVFINYLMDVKDFENVLFIYLLYKSCLTIILSVFPNDRFKFWCEDFTERKIYSVGNIVHIILIFYIYYIFEVKLYFFIVSITLIFLIPIISKLLYNLQIIQCLDFIQNSIFIVLCFLILVLLNDKDKILGIFYIYFFIKLFFLILFHIYLLYYINSNDRKIKLYNKNPKVNDWFKWFDNANLLHIYKFKNIGISFEVREALARENRDKSRFLERKILLRFKDKSEIEREKFILNRISGFLIYYVIVPILVSIPAIILTDVFFEKQISIKFVNYIFDKFNTITINKFMSSINEILIYTIIFVFVLVFVSLYTRIKFVLDKNKYLQLLNYISNNYENLCKEHNIKRIFITMNLNKKFKTTKKHLNYAIFNYDKIINSNNFKLDEFRKFLEFLEYNGIEVSIYSKDNKEKKIKKYLKYNELDDFEFIIIDKKEIAKNLNSKDKEFMVEFCKKLYISQKECFILVDSKDEKIYYEIASLEKDKIIKHKEPFYDLKEVLDFLQSNME